MTNEESNFIDYNAVLNKLKSTVWYNRSEGIEEVLKYLIDFSP